MGDRDVSNTVRDHGQEKTKAEIDGAVAGNAGNNGSEDLSWLKPKKVSDMTTVQPAQVIRGMLYKGCKLALMGGSKSYKTWTEMDMSYCVANGFRWWGVTTTKGPVVYLDFELLEYDFRWRMEQIHLAHIAMGDKGGDIDAVTRIGFKNKPIRDNYWPVIHGHIKEANAILVVCDPTYKLLNGRDENRAGDIAEVTAIFDRVTEATGAALVYSQHFGKGNQSAKESIDRGAGSGVWARDADSIVTMTAHKEGSDCLTVETTLRSFPRIDPFVVRWTNPLFVRDANLDPDDLKQPNQGGRPKDDCSEIIMAVFRACETKGGTTAKFVSQVTLINIKKVQRTIKELKPARLVDAVTTGKFVYQLSVSETDKINEFIMEQNKLENQEIQNETSPIRKS
jgi:hypothetical protein